ncbi:ligase-associated DNA damage response endonuclease PdeM [Changchengzhania lutea]|uniref:ligase-associated DNA damage response endonuclease PdeM n=1 Tax=Changchengzhania lutea TaxID=2049305 RepID=UPI00115D6FF0|nr:ligase-associated DNA damage response endonuclease PdeM [Changchengzhania lutea]
MQTKSIVINEQTFIMHPTGALFWVERSMLLIADIHFGKIMHFRKHGSAVPREAIDKNFDQLTYVCDCFSPKTVCFLGDLFHSNWNNEWIPFKDWALKTTYNKLLITGNHDVISPIEYENLEFKIYDELRIHNISLTHHPQTDSELFNIAGHIHPGIRLKGLGKQFLNVPCFYKTNSQMILPAFGNFTGKYIMKPNVDDAIFINTTSEVIQLDLNKQAHK